MLQELIIRLEERPEGFVEVTLWEQQTAESTVKNICKTCIHKDDQLFLRVQEVVNNHLGQLVNQFKRRNK